MARSSTAPKLRFLRFHCTKQQAKTINDALVLRTSALCRSKNGQLALPGDLLDPDATDASGEAAGALAAICADWLKNFTAEKLAEIHGTK